MLNPLTTHAQGGNIQGLLFDLGDVISNLTYVAFALALLVFLWGLAVFILNSGNENKIEDGKRLMFWGIIVLFIITSIWGIVQFLQITTGTDTNPIRVSTAYSEVR